MARRSFAALSACFALAAWPAIAGDGAAFEPLGISADGRFFAFEQYGSGDGSGFEYSEIHAIEIASNRPAPGFPIVYEAPDEAGQARDPVRQKAATKLAEFKLQPTPMLAFNGMAAPTTPLVSMDVNPVRHGEVRNLKFWSAWVGGETEIRLENKPVKSDHCASMDVEAAAPEITVLANGEKSSSFTDTADPGALTCPMGYGVAAALLAEAGEGPPNLIVVLSYYPLGFEGPDRRFRAFALPLPATQR